MRGEVLYTHRNQICCRYHITYADIDSHNKKIINMEGDKEFEAKKSFFTPLMWSWFLSSVKQLPLEVP